MESNTAKNFALQLGSLISLYLSLSFFLVLAFGIINVQFPDSADQWWNINQAEGGIRFGIAMVVVFFPTYLITTRYVNQIRRKETEGKYLVLTKWLIYLSLLLGGAVLLGNLVAVIATFLEGEITQRFILKALAVLVIIGGAFYYYIKDAKGYWVTHEKQSITIGVVTAAIVLATVVFGFFSIETPGEARERKIDEKQVQDLTEIQFRVEDYLNRTDSLPENLDDLYTSNAPTAPEDRAAYEYNLTDDGFALCATFTHASDNTDRYPVYPDKDQTIIGFYDWEHDAGRFCFERVVAQENGV